MVAISKEFLQMKGKTAIICLAVWFLISSLFYFIVYIWDGKSREKTIKTGISISKEISSQSGLPLLEKNTPLLGQLIEKIKERPEVVFASIIDHKNKLIAYTDQEQFLSLVKEKAGVMDGVHFWRLSKPSGNKVMNFSSEVTFSETRVGEVFISLKSENMDSLKRAFIFFAVLGFLAIGFLFVVNRYKECLLVWNAGKVQLHPELSQKASPSQHHGIRCPLCGHASQNSIKKFDVPDLDNFGVLKDPFVNDGDVLLSDIAENKELSWLKRLLITQCTKIINKVAAE